ncbi:DUF262 domain-containing protein [Sporolactobacillus sp. Y61]|uniref:DUF262 domain-containing protein n=1 Tax=Sporolactobacillus sp. Y61 TaxID=3160863 RepID=A0AAU8IFV7_9BACL
MTNRGKSAPVELIEKVDSKIEMVRTRSLDLSFNELLDMYQSEELEIAPEYQRLFRWSEEKQSQFIESLILEMPIPPIYVIETEEGVYELIDGLQRISSYLHFRGALKDSDFLRLIDCDIVTELNGYTYDELPKALQIKLKRNFIRVEVIRKGSDQRLRYYMFKRLNTGGELLSEQELRNCTIRLLDERFNDFIIELSRNKDFKACMTHLSAQNFNLKIDQEYVLKFFAFKNDREHYQKNIASFVTSYMEGVSYSPGEEEHIPFDYQKEKAIFNKTFAVLHSSLGEYAFARVNNHGNWVSSVSPTHFDAITLGIQPYIEELNAEDPRQMGHLNQLLKQIKQNSDFLNATLGGGKNTRSYLEQRIKLVEERVGEWLRGSGKTS